MNNTDQRIKVLVVDDSAVVRQSLTCILESDPRIRVIGAVPDPYAAAKKINEEEPDVITLDVAMPRMDGLTFLQKLMSQHPIPVVMVSSLTQEGSTLALKALEYGGVDIIRKPRVGAREFLEESRIVLCDAVRAAAQARVTRVRKVSPKLTADAVLEKSNYRPALGDTERIVVIGASTGGTEALRRVLDQLPINSPALAVVQHMPEHFTRAFAERLNRISSVRVKEASHEDPLIPGQVLIAPGDRHMLVKRNGSRYFVELKEGPLVNRHRPSVDVLFRSAARYAGKNAIGVIMTGMGDDGARGLLELNQAGAETIAQDKTSCVVFGMPNEAIKLGAVNRVLPLSRIASTILELAGR